tara:strand:+ start:341 stop:658 length:318 start_codon:yes stop_codon:yes gene_type:complete
LIDKIDLEWWWYTIITKMSMPSATDGSASSDTPHAKACRKYYEKNKFSLLIKNKQYREIPENKQAIKTQKNQPFKCECGGKFTQTHRWRHAKSNKHQKWLKQMSN